MKNNRPPCFGDEEGRKEGKVVEIGKRRCAAVVDVDFSVSVE
jgi:hypothetical protein